MLARNHPGEDPTPSRADIEMTKRIIEIADRLGIAVHDHIIVGRHGHASKGPEADLKMSALGPKQTLSRTSQSPANVTHQGHARFKISAPQLSHCPISLRQ